MVINLLVFAFFFSVNDSVITFNSGKIEIISQKKRVLTLRYLGKIEDYETGHYYFSKSKIKEINVWKKQNDVFMGIKLNKSYHLKVENNRIVFTRPLKSFFIKTDKITKEGLKLLFKGAKLHYNWLDSLAEMDYTLTGWYNEYSLKRRLLYHGRKKETQKIKKR